MAAIVVFNDVKITTYQLIGIRMWRREENILDKLWWLVFNMAVGLRLWIGCIIIKEILHGDMVGLM